MRIVDKKYNKMLESFDLANIPQVTAEIREDSGRCFKNHSCPSDDRLIANRPNSNSLKFALKLFEG